MIVLPAPKNAGNHFFSSCFAVTASYTYNGDIETLAPELSANRKSVSSIVNLNLIQRNRRILNVYYSGTGPRHTCCIKVIVTIKMISLNCPEHLTRLNTSSVSRQ